jgi:hypothetical protein
MKFFDQIKIFMLCSLFLVDNAMAMAFTNQQELNDGLLQAVWDRDAFSVNDFLQQGADPNIVDEINHRTPLFSATVDNDEQIVQLLLDAGANTEISNYFRETPLHVAVVNNHVNNISRLMFAGADLDARMYNGNTPIDLAFYHQNDELLEFLEYNYFLNHNQQRVEAHDTLFGHIVIDAYNKYFYNNYPVDLARLFGLDKSVPMPLSVGTRIAKFFVNNQLGQPKIFSYLVPDYNDYVRHGRMRQSLSDQMRSVRIPPMILPPSLADQNAESEFESESSQANEISDYSDWEPGVYMD